MSSQGSGWIRSKCCYFFMTNQLKNDIQRLNLDLYRIGHLSIKNFSNEELQRLKLESYQILPFLNEASIKERAPETQYGYIYIYIYMNFDHFFIANHSNNDL